MLRQIAGLLRIEHILVVPYMPDDAHTAIALRQATRAPLVTWVMDDQAVFSDKFPRPLLEELLAQSDIRFVISPEMKEEYQRHSTFSFSSFRRPSPKRCWTNHDETPRADSETKCCALIGNVWSAAWLTRLEDVIETSGWKVNWYGHDSARNEEKRGFVRKGFVSEAELAKGLAAVPFVISPTGTGDAEDDRLHLHQAQPSFPHPVPSCRSSRSHPRRRFRGELRRAVCQSAWAWVCPAVTTARNLRKRQSSFAIRSSMRAAAGIAERHAALFGDKDLAAWIWKSADAGTPIDSRFDDF